MADTKISALTDGNPAQSGDEIPIARSGANYKITAGSIASLGGDVDGPASATDNQIALFDSTTGKLIKAATTTGLLKASSGVIAAATSGTDYAPATTGTNAQLLANNGSGGFSNVTVGSGLTLSAGTLTASGGGGGGLAWQSVQTTGFTAVAGRAYPCNTTSAAFTVTLPASASAGDQITLTDYAGTFGTNNLIINPNGGKIRGSTSNAIISVSNNSVQLVYVDSTQGWIVYAAVSATPFTPPPPTVEYLVVAGGGGGAGLIGGGGGGGGYRTNTGLAVTAGFPYSVTVGGGGAGGSGSTSPHNGAKGSDSVFDTITSTGGGYGASSGGSAANGGPGGSGGGSSVGGTAGPGNTPSTTPSQGNNGGVGATASNLGAGGGGGAGGVGGNGSSTVGGSGGIGIQGPSFAASYGGAGPGGSPSTGYFSGGGGGGTYAGGTGGTGGYGGGANGSANDSTPPNATANSGGGGGGGGAIEPAPYGTGGNGGAGIVIIRYSSTYAAAVATTGSPTITVSGGYRTYVWTGNGSITW
jgi:hypothetical protein